MWGTFDLLHKGHEVFLAEAARLGDLYVIIVPDTIVYQNKGHWPVYDEEERRRVICKLPYVCDAHIDSLENGLRTFIELKPAFFCAGYDQNQDFEFKLIDFCSEKQMAVCFVRLGEYAGGIHSSHLRKPNTLSDSSDMR